ncbi:DUF6154 family protein [Aquibacillus sediminis]|uniref:DUF6154 family protein n=1 Tax=Aquibacillus sediminis TaxID=2574734 RepID=UPI001108703B|nr:DUF6154 family protein [Aquibacillus sediminis]
MKFADEVLELYLKHFNDDESESLEVFIHSILEQMDHKDLLEICRDCHKEELNTVLAHYLHNHVGNKLKNTIMDDEDDSSFSQSIQ